MTVQDKFPKIYPCLGSEKVPGGKIMFDFQSSQGVIPDTFLNPLLLTTF